jgi:large subunit ribosomal protein L5
MARLLEYYRKNIVPELQKDLGRTNLHSLPQLTKIVISMGIGDAMQDRKKLEEGVEHLGMIAGQKPQICRSRNAISNFRLRENMEIGCRVTLRGKRMYEFLDRLINLALPRVRDFRGINPKGFDGRGNFSMGLTEKVVFPEIPGDKMKYNQGMNIAIVTTTDSNEEARLLLDKFGFPFRKPATKN